MDIGQIIVPLQFVVLFFLMIYNTIPNFFSKNKARIWSPINFITLYLFYYIILPYISGCEFVYSKSINASLPFLFGGALLSYISILLGFKIRCRHFFFKKNNFVFDVNNSKSFAIILFCIGILVHVLFKGFSFDVFSNAEYAEFDENGSFNHTSQYLTSLISLFCVSTCLFYAYNRKFNLWVLLSIIVGVTIYLISGFRFRLVLLLVSFITFFYLYPYPKKINYMLLVPIFLCFYILMGVVENTRNYGKGLNIDKLKEVNRADLMEGAKENEMVYAFSALVMDHYTNKNLLYFEPIITAVSMPIPRVIFPFKPTGKYLRDANMEVLGTITTGAAFLYFVEAYLAFSWVGIIVNGLFIGFVSRIFWDNYSRNYRSVNAILLLALFNGVLFVVISRGYLAQVFTIYMYFIIIPFLLGRLLVRLNKYIQAYK